MGRLRMRLHSRNGQLYTVAALVTATAFGSVYLGILPAGIGLPLLDAHDTPEPNLTLIVQDGAEWMVVNRLRERNRVPHLEAAMQDGVYGDFRTPRAFSPITWTVIGTGLNATNVNPDGWNVKKPDGEVGMVESGDVINKRIWDYLNDGGIRTGVVQWFLTWPVTAIDGFMVAGAAAQSNNGLAYPPNHFNDTVMEVIRSSDEWRIANTLLNVVNPLPPFLALGFKRTDALQHQLWKFMEPQPFGLEHRPEDQPYREAVYQEYENLDAVVGRFRSDRNILVVGDSGFEPEMAEYGYAAPTYELNLNPLLSRLGYAQFEYTTVQGQTIDTPLEGTSLVWCPVRYPVNDVITATRYRFRLCIHDTTLNVTEAITTLKHVDYRDGRDFLYDLSYDRADNAIRGKLSLPEGGKVKTKIRQGESHQPISSGNMYYVDAALGLELPNGSSYNLWIGPEKTGDHPPGTDSLFIASGPAFRDAGKLENADFSSYDVAPTILYMYGLPIPTGMDGHPATELFTDRFNAERTIRYTNASTRNPRKKEAAETNSTLERRLRERLRDLGYAVGEPPESYDDPDTPQARQSDTTRSDSTNATVKAEIGRSFNIFFTAAYNRSYGIAYERFTPQIRRHTSLNNWRAALEERLSQRNQTNDAYRFVQVLRVDTAGRTATVTFLVEGPQEYIQEEVVAVQSPDGEWQMAEQFNPYFK